MVECGQKKSQLVLEGHTMILRAFSIMLFAISLFLSPLVANAVPIDGEPPFPEGYTEWPSENILSCKSNIILMKKYENPKADVITSEMGKVVLGVTEIFIKDRFISVIVRSNTLTENGDEVEELMYVFINNTWNVFDADKDEDILNQHVGTIVKNILGDNYKKLIEDCFAESLLKS